MVIDNVGEATEIPLDAVVTDVAERLDVLFDVTALGSLPFCTWSILRHLDDFAEAVWRISAAGKRSGLRQKWLSSPDGDVEKSLREIANAGEDDWESVLVLTWTALARSSPSTPTPERLGNSHGAS